MKNIINILFICLSLPAFSQGIVWEDQGLTDEAVVPSGTSFSDNSGDYTVTLTWNIVDNNSGGVFKKCCGDDFVSYEEQEQGGHAGHIGLGFNNSSEDPFDKICVTLSFNPPVTGLKFSLLDVDEADDDDSSSHNNWDDAVEVFYNGNNNGQEFGTLAGPCTWLDSEVFMTGFEGETYNSSPCGDDGTDNKLTDSNVDFDFGDQSVSSVTIKYFSSNDLIIVNNPDVQLIGISDLEWDLMLPVEYARFSAREYAKGINVINWVTVNELNNDRFEILHSQDGKRFETIGEKEGIGTTADNQEYQFFHQGVAEGINYYRLKQIDNNGESRYSNIVNVNNTLDSQSFSALRISPNPVQNGILELQSSFESNIELEIFDALGQKLRSFSMTGESMSVDVSDLGQGVYYVLSPDRELGVVSFIIADAK